MSYPSYPEYQDSGIDWLGMVPAGWQVNRLKDGGSLVSGIGFPHDFQGLEGEEYQFYKVGDLESSSDGKYMSGASNTISATTLKILRARSIPAGSILWAKIGAALLLNRRRISTVKCCIDNNMTAYVPNSESIVSDWAYYWTSILDFGQVANPGAVPSLGEGYQEILPLLVPPRSEQTQIARFLDHQTARIDALIAEQQRLIELLKEKRQAVISHAVTKGLDPDVAMKDSGVEWLGKVPEHWTTCKATYLGRFFGSEPIADNEIVSDGNVPVLKVASLSKDSIEVREWEWYAEPERENIYRPHSNFVAFPKRGAAIFINKVNVVRTKALLDPNLMGWKVSPDVCLDYMAYSLKCRDISDLADVSTVPQINNKHIAPEKFPCPPRDEQERISSFIDRRTYDFEELITTALKTVDLLEERRSALISAAVTGKIDVREWEPPVSETFPQSTVSEEVSA